MVILSTTTVLFVYLVIIRAQIIGVNWTSIASLLVTALESLIASFFDFVFIIGLGFVGLTLHYFSPNARMRWIVCLIYILAAFVTLAFAAVNVRAVQLLGGPLNYRWLYYSDSLGMANAVESVREVLSRRLLVMLLIGAMALITMSLLLSRLLLLGLRRNMLGRLLLYGSISFCLLYLPGSAWYLGNQSKWEYAKLENPTIAFLDSLLAQDAPELFTMHTDVDPEDFQTVAERNSPTMSTLPVAKQEIEHVLIFVLESIAAQYLDAYDGPFAVTPELDKYQEQSIKFRSIYAHSPTTNKSVVSLLCPSYPWVSYRVLTQEFPDVSLSCLSSKLRAKGFRTAFFSSGDTDYLKEDEFLSHRHFDMIEDFEMRACERPTRTNSSLEMTSAFEGSDDECTADSLLAWLNQDVEQPSFAVLWTNMTHYPYFTVDEESDFPIQTDSEWTKEHFNRYLNALKHGDRAIGKILRALEQQGRLKSTLVVIVGDHGEAFGQHGQFGHGSNIYEENIHVPLILINSQLFHGDVSNTVGGLVDIGPTIMDILEQPLPGTWQGWSLFDESRSPRTYFYSTYKEFLFGYREADFKYLYNASADRFEVFNLREDPFETINLADQFLTERNKIEQRLAAWVQYQNKYTEKLVAGP